MKNLKWILLSTTAILVAAFAIIGVFSFLAPSKTSLLEPVYAAETAETEKGIITVSGAGSVNVNPDVAFISLGVNTQALTPTEALEKNNKRIAEVIKAVRDMGIADKDIRTTDFNMYPNYDYSDYTRVPEKVSSYTVNNSVSVVVRDISIVGGVLGAAADAGANVSGGVQFGLLDESSVYNEALALAIKNASGKVSTIAEALGKAIGSPASVTETVNYYSPYSSFAGAQNMSMDASVGSVPVQSGKLTITAQVQMVYEYAK